MSALPIHCPKCGTPIDVDTWAIEEPRHVLHVVGRCHGESVHVRVPVDPPPDSGEMSMHEPNVPRALAELLDSATDYDAAVIVHDELKRLRAENAELKRVLTVENQLRHEAALRRDVGAEVR